MYSMLVIFMAKTNSPWWGLFLDMALSDLIVVLLAFVASLVAFNVSHREQEAFLYSY